MELKVESGDTWKATVDALLDALPMSGFTGVIVGIIAVEVAIVVGELLRMRRRRLAQENRRLRADLEEQRGRAEKAEAENAELRRKLEDSGVDSEK